MIVNRFLNSNISEKLTIKVHKSFILIFLLFLLFSAFIPFLLLPLSVITLFFLGLSDYKVHYKAITITSIFFAIVGLLIHVMGLDNFTTQSDDFVTYYNNYVSLLSGDYKAIFQFGGGVEVGLPIINYFLSLIIGDEYPYVVKFFHCFFILLLFLMMGIRICTYYKLNWKETSLLFSLLICFFKLSLVFYFLRQGYASFFIIFMFFSTSKYRYSYLIIAIMFHAASLVVYPLVRILLSNKGRQYHKKYSLLMIISSLGLLSSLTLLSNFSFNIPIIEKINFILYYLGHSNFIEKAIVTSVKSLLYFIPLVFIVLSFRIKMSQRFISHYCLMTIVVFIISFSFLPGVVTRLAMPILSYLIGFMYFSVFMSINSNLIKIITLTGMLILLNLQWQLKDENYYFKYPLVSTTPFYYLSLNFKSLGHVPRHSLPTESKNINKNKL